MSREERLWKVLTFIVTLAGIASSFYFHWDAKRSTENKIVEALSERYESVDKEMSYEQALQAVDKDIKKLENDKSTLQSENSDLNSKNTVLNEKISDLEHEIDALKKDISYSEKIAQAETYAASGNYDIDSQ